MAVRNLLDLNRPGKHLLQTVDVNRVIENTLALVRGTLKKNKVRTLLLLSAQIPGIIATPRQGRSESFVFRVMAAGEVACSGVMKVKNQTGNNG